MIPDSILDTLNSLTPSLVSNDSMADSLVSIVPSLISDGGGWMHLPPEVIGAIVGAFFGAFFAFGYTQLHYTMVKNRELWTRHLNALVTIESRLNVCMDLINSNRYVANSYIELFNKLEADIKLKGVLWATFQRVPEFDETARDLQNLDIKNLALKLDVKIRKMNNATRVVDEAYGELRRVFFEKGLEWSPYNKLTKDLLKGVKHIHEACNTIDERVIALAAHNRAQLNTDKSMTAVRRRAQLDTDQADTEKAMKIWRFHKRRESVSPTPDKIELVRKDIEREIVLIQTQSRLEIEREMGDKGPPN
jgi:hypothetical protein